MSLLITSI